VVREDRGPITILRLNRGKANALDVRLLGAFASALDVVAHDGHRAIVLTAEGPIFSAGVDLFKVLEGGDTYVTELLPLLDRVLQRLFWYPRPVVAAINGHAIAGGCVLASACDHRIMADGPATIGVPELRVQVPFPSSAIEILRFAVAHAHFQELVYLGRTYSVGEARDRGLVDEVVPSAELLERACAAAERLHAIPPKGFWLTKRQLRWSARQRMQDGATRTEADVTALWLAPETRAAIARYVEDRLGSGSHNV